VDDRRLVIVGNDGAGIEDVFQQIIEVAAIGAGDVGADLAADAIQQVNDQDVVFIRKSEDRFELRLVRLGDMVNGRVVILDGAEAGEAVVTRGSFVLKSQLLKASLENE